MTAGNSSSPSPAPSRDERWLWVLFAFAWLVNVRFSVIGWENSLLSRFEFRQVQTAISSLFMPETGFRLDYITPLFGPPYSIPMEFPLFQASVAWFASATGMDLDPAGRLVSWCYFQLSLPAFFILLGSCGVRPSLRWIGLSLLLTSPIFLFFSRTFMIESTALCFCAWFLAGFARWMTTRKISWLALAATAGALGATVKVTTMVVFGAAACVYAAGWWWQQTRHDPTRRRPAAFAVGRNAIIAFLVPMILGLAWLVYSSKVRHLNPEAGILETAFGFWSFGDLPQRFSAKYWYKTLEVWSNGLVSQAGLIIGLYLYARLRTPLRPVVVGGFLAFLSGQMIFSNLYMVHGYYFYASGPFLILGLGVLLAVNFEDTSLPRWSRWALPLVIMACQLIAFTNEYLEDQRRNEEPSELMRVVRDLTDPGQMIVILGQDWDGSIPYYARRRALMLTAGRERDYPSIAASVRRLNPDEVGAVLLFGHVRNDVDFVNQAMPSLDLGRTPLLTSDSANASLWVPVKKAAAARERMPSHSYKDFRLVEAVPEAGGPSTFGAREIARLHEFSIFPQRPLRATSHNGFSNIDYKGTTVLNAHPPSELAFRATPTVRVVRAEFGIHDGAYANPTGSTDGVEFVVTLVEDGGAEHILYSRLLNPAANAADRGKQSAEINLPFPHATGEIRCKTLPGPQNNLSYDWAFWAQIELH